MFMKLLSLFFSSFSETVFDFVTMGVKENEFVQSAGNGDFNKVKRFLETRQVDVNCRDEDYNSTALFGVGNQIKNQTE